MESIAMSAREASTGHPSADTRTLGSGAARLRTSSHLPRPHLVRRPQPALLRCAPPRCPFGKEPLATRPKPLIALPSESARKDSDVLVSMR